MHGKDVTSEAGFYNGEKFVVHDNDRMDSAELLTTLADLKENRRIASEITALMDPLRGQEYNLKLIFASASRTFGNKFGSKYDNGYTALCKTTEGEVEISVMFPAGTNSAIEDMEPGHAFEAEVTLLDFDALYQRAILGCAAEKVTLQEESVVDEEPKEIPKATAAARDEEKDYLEVEPLPNAPTGRKTWPIALTSISLLAVIYAGSQWSTIDSSIGWIAWALLIYPVGLGLPCVANRSWICLFLALAAFVFDVTGTLVDYREGAFQPDVVELEDDSREMDHLDATVAFKRITPGTIYYHVAMTLQATALLGLAISLKIRMGSMWPAVMALLFSGFTFQFIKIDYYEFGETTVSQINPAFAFLIATCFCCWAIIKHEMKLGAEESSKSEAISSQ